MPGQVIRTLSAKHPRILFVLGPPGSGKGTQCTKIARKYNFMHLSAGDLLRAERNVPDSIFARVIEGHIKNGTIVPVEITCALIERKVMDNVDRVNYFLVDGFPRNEDNYAGWQREIANKVEELGVLFLECAEETCIARCLERGAAGSGRTDDNIESLRKRFVTYQNETLPIVNRYKERNQAHTVDTTSRTADEVFEEVEKIIMQIAPLCRER